MNASEEDLKKYIELFFSTLESTAKEYLPEDLQRKLLHLSLLPSHIIGYVSTQFGIAIEYQPSEVQEIEIRRGSARIEDLLLQAPSAFRNIGPNFRFSSPGNGIVNMSFSGGFPFRLVRPEANISFANVSFEIGKWKRSIHFAEVFGNRTKQFWLPERAVARAKDEVLVAMLHEQRAKKERLSLSEYVANFKKKLVLILGDYDNGSERLEKIASIISQLGYDPLLIKEVPDHPYQDLRQKVVAIGSVSRFIVVDDSSKSGHLLEVGLCDQNKWVTVLLRSGGEPGSWMTAGLANLSNVILEQPYDPISPESSLMEAVNWAEEKLTKLKVNLDSTYPWRMQAIEED